MMKMLQPGSTLGMLGGGQLGRMSIMAGKRMGYRFVVLDPSATACAASVADHHLVGDYDDPALLTKLASQVDRVTLEFENIPAAALSCLEELNVEVCPGRKALETCQNRLREKRFLAAAGLPHAPFTEVSSAEELRDAIARIGHPCVLKTADFGYDGKGQIKLTGGENPEQVWQQFNGARAVLEGWVNFSGEYSVICGRNAAGQRCVYPLVHNEHRNHILHTSVSPAGVDSAKEQQATEIALRVLEGLELIGIVAIELFLTDTGWVVNEMAPRPHNSGHLSLEANLTSQFEQHIRMVCGLPPGDTALTGAGCMLNLLGDAWQGGWPLFSELMADPLSKLHLYDKGEPRRGRKMGHMSFLGNDPTDCLRRADAAHRKLQGA